MAAKVVSSDSDNETPTPFMFAARCAALDVPGNEQDVLRVVEQLGKRGLAHYDIVGGSH